MRFDEEKAKQLLIPKKDLESGEYYVGYGHRTGHVHMWIENKGFAYIRFKFGNIFIDYVEHPEDDRGFALFYPIKKIESI